MVQCVAKHDFCLISTKSVRDRNYGLKRFPDRNRMAEMCRKLVVDPSQEDLLFVPGHGGFPMNDRKTERWHASTGYHMLKFHQVGLVYGQIHEQLIQFGRCIGIPDGFFSIPADGLTKYGPVNMGAKIFRTAVTYQTSSLIDDGVHLICVFQVGRGPCLLCATSGFLHQS